MFGALLNHRDRAARAFVMEEQLPSGPYDENLREAIPRREDNRQQHDHGNTGSCPTIYGPHTPPKPDRDEADCSNFRLSRPASRRPRPAS
jgi:hypothetical protein